MTPQSEFDNALIIHISSIASTHSERDSFQPANLCKLIQMFPFNIVYDRFTRVHKLYDSDHLMHLCRLV